MWHSTNHDARPQSVDDHARSLGLRMSVANTLENGTFTAEDSRCCASFDGLGTGWLAFGEGWHNNHHAFEYSARHGLRPRQFDITYAIIALFERIGLVTQVKLPTEAAKARLKLGVA